MAYQPIENYGIIGISAAFNLDRMLGSQV